MKNLGNIFKYAIIATTKKQDFSIVIFKTQTKKDAKTMLKDAKTELEKHKRLSKIEIKKL